MPLQVIRQDITKIECDAIVTPTSMHFSAKGGIDGAVHQLAGSELDAVCSNLPELQRGGVAVTEGYGLKCKYIIHACGPVWEGGIKGEASILRDCYAKALNAAKRLGCETVALPLISAGHYGFPKELSLAFAMETVAECLEDCDMTVYLCVFDRSAYNMSKALFDDIKSYIDDHYADARANTFCRALPPTESATKPNLFRRVSKPDKATAICASERPDETLADFLKNMGDGFTPTLLAYIDKSGMTDVECYKKANVDKKVFSKIKCNKNYRPSKQTALAFAIALRLSLDDTNKLLASAGLALSHGSKFDMIIEYFIRKGNYNIFEINEALFEFDQTLLGSV